MKKRVLLTGGSGFVGASLVRRLLRDGHEISLLVRPQYKSWRLTDILKDVRVQEIDLLNQDGLARIFKDVKPDWCFNLAAFGAYSHQEDLQPMIQTNTMGTINLVQACLKTSAEVFVQAGSSSEYGYKDHPPREDEGLSPNSYYALTKAWATLFCLHTAAYSQLRIPVLRLYSAYGPFEEPSRFIPTLVLRALEGTLPPLVDPKIARDFVYIDDVVEAFVQAASSSRKDAVGIFNVGTGIQTSIDQAVTTARKVFSVKEKPRWGTMKNRKWDTSVWVANNSKIRKTLAWEPRINLAEGLQKTAEWLRSNPGMLRHYKKEHSSS